MQLTPVTARTTDTAATVTQALATNCAESRRLQEKNSKACTPYSMLWRMLRKILKNVSKHDETRSVIRNTSLDEYYTRSQTTEWLFAVADQVDEGKCEGALPKSFRAKVPGWIRMKNLLYDRLRKKCIEESGEDEEYKCFSELSPRLLKKALNQVPGRQNNSTSQGRNTTKAQVATKVGASNKRRHGICGRTAMAAPTWKHGSDSCSSSAHEGEEGSAN